MQDIAGIGFKTHDMATVSDHRNINMFKLFSQFQHLFKPWVIYRAECFSIPIIY